jgi:hypothetical protein
MTVNTAELDFAMEAMPLVSTRNFVQVESMSAYT